MTPRKAHHYSHSRLPLVFPSLTYVGSAGTTLQVTLSHECHFYDFARAGGTFLECSSMLRRVRSRSSSVPVALRKSGGVACVLSTKVPLRGTELTTDRCRESRGRSNKFSKNSRKGRTELSAQSLASTASESILLISRASHGRRKLNSISRILCASTRAPVVAGLPATTSRPPKHWASSSPRS
jgi:hypothetical protein